MPSEVCDSAGNDGSSRVSMFASFAESFIDNVAAIYLLLVSFVPSPASNDH